MPRVEHIGIAVRDVDAVVKTFRELLGTEPYKAETVADQQVRTHYFVTSPNPTPISRSSSSMHD